MRGAGRKRSRPAGLGDREQELDLGELCERAGHRPGARARSSRSTACSRRGSRAASGSTARATPTSPPPAAGSPQFGIDARHLRTFKNSAGRESSLLEQLVAPALRSRNPERRKAGLEDLQSLAEASQELSQLLFWRELRQLAER